MKKMKKIITCFSCLFFLLTNVIAKSSAYPIVVRTADNKVAIEEMELEDLVSDQYLQGKHFTIMVGKSDSIVSLDAHPELLLKAATTYYHLTKARRFFVEELQSEYVVNMPNIIVRVDISNKYDRYGLFAHDHLCPQHNNALAVPPGKGMPHRGVPAWNYQIWFRPGKKIKMDEIDHQFEDFKDLKTNLKGKKNKIHKTNLENTASSIWENSGNASSALVKGVIGSGAIELIHQNLETVARVFSPKRFYMETALMPEVIYHEFCHIALSEYMPATHSKGVIEGYADYFAARINGHATIGKKIKKYSNFSGKNANNDREYGIDLEKPDYANFDFVLSLMWDIKKELGEKKADQIILKAAAFLNSSSDIKSDLTQALIKSCRAHFATSQADQLKLLHIFDQRGM